MTYNTNEGKGAWNEAIQFLNNQKPLPPMTFHAGLAKAAADHANDLASNNMMGKLSYGLRPWWFHWFDHVQQNREILPLQ
jgi:uncharacterized protein YkwD